MKLYELAKRIAKFVWEYDPYETANQETSYEDFETETFETLCNKKLRKTIVNWLYGCETETEMAYALAKEVNALG